MSDSYEDSQKHIIPQWKLDLMARLRNHQLKTKRGSTVAVETGETIHNLPTVNGGVLSSSVAVARNDRICQHTAVVGFANKHSSSKMVQQPDNFDFQSDTSSSTEELHYGPGIVHRLRNKYLSLAFRETVGSRPHVTTIFSMRKAASLENLLDGKNDNSSIEGPPTKPTDTHRDADCPMGRPSDLKRAYSVELLTSEDQPKAVVSNNRPMRPVPTISDKEKPPPNVVQQAKLIFERRAEQRTKPPQYTGEVAAKVATYKSILVSIQKQQQQQTMLKKHTVLFTQNKANAQKVSVGLLMKPLHPPDVSRIDSLAVNHDGMPKCEALVTMHHQHNSSLSETPDLILTSSPIVSSTAIAPFHHNAMDSFACENHCHMNTNGDEMDNINMPQSQQNERLLPYQCANLQPLQSETNGNAATIKRHDARILQFANQCDNNYDGVVNDTSDGSKRFNQSGGDNCLSNSLVLREFEKNGVDKAKTFDREIKTVEFKNHSNSTTSAPVPSNNNRSNNSVVFKFTDRKDVPDYLFRGKLQRISRPHKTKVTDEGVMLLPGVSLGESLTDDDDDIFMSLEAPPSPCDVTFINDNVLIDGKSNLCQNNKRPKMRISFVNSGPEIYEYPSESSLLLEEIPTLGINAHLCGHTVSPLTGSPSLANYTPKTTEEFQPGITRSPSSSPHNQRHKCVPLMLTENGDVNIDSNCINSNTDKSIVFSTGTNSDMLF